jgi:hypothetical protein
LKPRRAEIRGELARVDPRLQLDRAAAPEEGGPAPRREVRVEEDRQRELLPDPSRELERRRACALGVGLPDRDDRDDVGGADARMSALVAAEVDPLARARDARQQRGHEIRRAADERVDGAVVILVRVDVEQACLPGQRLADRVDGRPVASLGEVRHGLEREHGLGPYAPRR